MGDIRLLRRSIVHHGGIALRDVERCELLQWFKEGDLIYLDFDMFKTMVGHINEMLIGYQRQFKN
jgi:hypothetical protein